MENWSILDGYAASPVDPSCDAAYTLKLARGDEQVETIVEFAAPSAVASRGYAEEKLGAFLRDDEPPQRVVVERDGSVTVASGPRVRGANEPPRPARRASQPEPQRARKRRHG